MFLGKSQGWRQHFIFTCWSSNNKTHFYVKFWNYFHEKLFFWSHFFSILEKLKCNCHNPIFYSGPISVQLCSPGFYSIVAMGALLIQKTLAVIQTTTPSIAFWKTGFCLCFVFIRTSDWKKVELLGDCWCCILLQFLTFKIFQNMSKIDHNLVNFTTWHMYILVQINFKGFY